VSSCCLKHNGIFLFVVIPTLLDRQHDSCVPFFLYIAYTKDTDQLVIDTNKNQIDKLVIELTKI